MPVWHERTKALQASGDVQMVGIIQEQNPDRCTLFMQWKQMGWPIMVDSLNLLGIGVVPYHVLIDEQGVVWKAGARPSDIEAFLAQPTATTDDQLRAKTTTPDIATLRNAAKSGDANDLRALADALFMWGKKGAIDEVIALFTKALAAGADAGSTNFRLGVAHRRRFEGATGGAADFAQAIAHWRSALDANPNQYIWRRRIQQYGPRLDKPYPFYDWVSRAREAIKARGESPAPLLVEPQGAELATPERRFASSTATQENPDPQGRIDRDVQRLIRVSPVVVASTNTSGATMARVHLIFEPDARQLAHWNNEVEPLKVWIDPPAGWRVDANLHSAPNAPAEVSTEQRSVEFELQAPADAAAPAKIRAYALYYVCEDRDGVCLYRRQDIAIAIDLRK